jgi:hypothetical protein
METVKVKEIAGNVLGCLFLLAIVAVGWFLVQLIGAGLYWLIYVTQDTVIGFILAAIVALFWPF